MTRGHQRRRSVLVLALLTAALALPALPAAANHDWPAPPASETGWDCTNRFNDWDTWWDRPYVFSTLDTAAGVTCNSTLEWESSWWEPEDDYRYYATVDDYVDVQYGAATCGLHWHERHQDGAWSATQEGSWPHLVGETGYRYIQVWEDPYGSINACDNVALDYAIYVRVYPNDRPTLSLVSAPAVVLPGEPYDYTVRGRDVDSNMSEMSADAWGQPARTYPVNGGRDVQVAFSLALDQSGSVFFGARDAYGAIANGLRHDVTVREDDCGLGRDAGVESLELGGAACRAHVWPPIDDWSDTFQVQVPEGTARLSADYTKVSGDLKARVSIIDPFGQVVATSDGGSPIAEVTAGVWQIKVESRYGTKGRYDLRARALGPPAPPTFAAGVSPSPQIHQGDEVRVSLQGSDPNEHPITYTVGWGDGSAPSTLTLASGASGEVRHVYAGTTTAPVLTVDAVNVEGLAAEQQRFPLAVTLHNDCGRSGYDAPFQRTGPVIELAGVCSGELGYAPADGSLHGADLWDYYRLTSSGLRTRTVRMTVHPGLHARLVAEAVGGLVRIESVESRLGFATQQTLTLPPGASYFIVAERIGGKGAYTLSVE